MIEYPQYFHLSEDYITTKIAEFLAEDMPDGDKTTESTIPKNPNVKAEIQAVENLIFAGEEIIPHCFGKNCTILMNKKDGDSVLARDILGVVNGPAGDVLSRERVMLNLIQRLCGIATVSRKYADLAEPYNVKILDTRKTTPGLRLFEKYAVSVGGAFNHRLNLSEGILIKDNHIAASGSVSDAIRAARNSPGELPVELEVDNLNQIKQALEIGVNGFLLDNMNRETILQAVSLIRHSKNGKNVFVEASGGITFENIQQYLDTGINGISIGALTHGVISKDIRLEFIV